MSPPNTANRKQVQQQRHSLVDRCSTIRACEPCRGRKRICNGEAPGCIYNMISDHARSVFTTSTARRLSSGSACETCRRRKTKCDAGQPCSYCAANNLKCVNNAERRKRSSMSVVSTSLSSPSSTSTSPSSAMNLPASFSSPSSNTFLGNTNSDHEAMDRIEDRLRRIEQLMTVFTPSPLSQSTLYPDDVYRTCRTKDNSNNISPHFVRQQRHSVQGITVAKEQLELQIARRAMSLTPPQFGNSSSTSSDLLHAGAYITPPNSGGKKQQQHQHHQQSSSSSSSSSSPLSSPLSASPPLSPEASTNMIRQTSNTSQPLTSSILNLTLSPSSSTSSSSNTSSMHVPQSSLSTPLNDQQQQQQQSYHQHQYGSLGSSSQQQQQQQRDFHSLGSTVLPMPSLMDQLSKRTFTANHFDHPIRSSYPIYPLTPSPPAPPATTYAEASFSP